MEDFIFGTPPPSVAKQGGARIHGRKSPTYKSPPAEDFIFGSPPPSVEKKGNARFHKKKATPASTTNYGPSAEELADFDPFMALAGQ